MNVKIDIKRLFLGLVQFVKRLVAGLKKEEAKAIKEQARLQVMKEVKKIVQCPEAVVVKIINNNAFSGTFKIIVAHADRGRVIGKNGTTINEIHKKIIDFGEKNHVMQFNLIVE